MTTKTALKIRWKRCVAFSSGGIALLVIGYRLAVVLIPYPSDLADRPAEATWIFDRHRLPLATLVSEDGMLSRHADSNQLGPYLANAIVAVEDERFYQHGGVDWRSVFGAAASDLRSLCGGGSIRRGASTISMQLERLRDPRPRTLFNKIEQAFRADQIERRESKEAILLEYLNRAPFGGNLVGAAAASERYFGKEISALSLSQAALLAGLPQSPNALRPDRHPARAIARRDHVLKRMLACRMIDDAACRNAIAEPIAASWLSLPQVDRAGPTAPLAMGAMPTLIAATQSLGGGQVALTIDADTQAKTFSIAQEGLQAFNAAESKAALAAVVLDVDNAECLAAVSLGDRPGIDLTHRRRSTGSALKPFIYSAAFEAHLSAPESLLSDTPATWIGYEPRNFDHSFRGQIDAKGALAESRNLPAMKLLSHVGINHMTSILADLGVRIDQSNRPTGLTLAVGGVEASAWEMAQAYATLARGGDARDATILPYSTPPARPVLTKSACLAVLHAIDGIDRTRAVCPAAAALGPAWKTGTSSGSRDAWCAAVTPRRVVIIWMGMPDGSGDPALQGFTAAAPIALKVIAAIDPGGQDFNMDTSRSTSFDVSPIAFHRASITITAPTMDQQFILQPDVPFERQCVTCRVFQSTDQKTSIWWFIDDLFVAETSGNDPLLWTPRPGSHLVRAVDQFGNASSVRFAVIAP